jgi:predicted aconitase
MLEEALIHLAENNLPGLLALCGLVYLWVQNKREDRQAKEDERDAETVKGFAAAFAAFSAFFITLTDKLNTAEHERKSVEEKAERIIKAVGEKPQDSVSMREYLELEFSTVGDKLSEILLSAKSTASKVEEVVVVLASIETIMRSFNKIESLQEQPEGKEDVPESSAQSNN